MTYFSFDIAEARAHWDAHPDQRAVFLLRRMKEKHFDLLLALGTEQWPLSSPTLLCDAQSEKGMFGIRTQFRVWKAAVETQHVPLLLHLRSLAPQEWRRFLEGSLIEGSVNCVGTDIETHDEHACAVLMGTGSLTLLKTVWQNAWHRQAGLKDAWLLVTAATQGWTEGVAYLLEQGCSPDGRLSERASKRTALMMAVWHVHAPVVKLLLHHGANPFLKDSYDADALTRMLCQGVSRNTEEQRELYTALLQVIDPRQPLSNNPTTSLLEQSAKVLPWKSHILFQEAALRFEQHEALKQVLHGEPGEGECRGKERRAEQIRARRRV